MSSSWWTQPANDSCGNPIGGSCSPYAQQPNSYSAGPPDASFIALSPPTPTVVVLTVEPNVGPPVGGTAVTIRGSGFGSGATVTFDGTAATSVVVLNQYTITCNTPAHASGAGNVVVTNVDGTHN